MGSETMSHTQCMRLVDEAYSAHINVAAKTIVTLHPLANSNGLTSIMSQYEKGTVGAEFIEGLKELKIHPFVSGVPVQIDNKPLGKSGICNKKTHFVKHVIQWCVVKGMD